MEDRRFRDRLVEVLCEEWERTSPGDVLGSETLYERLGSEGAEVPDGALSEGLAGSDNEGLITIAGLHEGGAVRKRGGWAIGGVRTDLLC